MARTGLSDAARVARWADAALRPGRDGANPGGKAPSPTPPRNGPPPTSG